MVRSTSEDVVTGEIFSRLEAIEARHWVPALMNLAFGIGRVRQKLFRGFRIELWQNQPSLPPDLCPSKEGQTEVDVILSWENPPTSVFIEMKYTSPVSSTTTHGRTNSQYPSDQLIRNARVGLHRCGWYSGSTLFARPKRDFLLLLITPTSGSHLVAKYRCLTTLKDSIPGGKEIASLPDSPFIGQLSFADIVSVLQQRQNQVSRSERVLIDQLTNYLNFKIKQLPEPKVPSRQLPLLPMA